VEDVAVPDPSRAAVYEKLLPAFRMAADSQARLGDVLAALDLRPA
jgi:hypothetical protein